MSGPSLKQTMARLIVHCQISNLQSFILLNDVEFFDTLRYEEFAIFLDDNRVIERTDPSPQPSIPNLSAIDNAND